MVRIFLNFKNKKIQVLSMLTLFNLISYGTNVDDLISQYEKDSYTIKINEKSMRKYDIKDRALKNGDWNEVFIIEMDIILGIEKLLKIKLEFLRH